MSDEITFAGKTYVSSKRAARLSGYAQDYIGQLARSHQIEAQRIGGLWYVSMESLQGFKKYPKQKGEIAPAVASASTPEVVASEDAESFISFDGKDYISASRASNLSGYNQDYVGQLARSGQILARQIGNRWYVDREGILKHKQDKDALLAAVQADSVGLPSSPLVPAQMDSGVDDSLRLTYSAGEGDLLPVIPPKAVILESELGNLELDSLDHDTQIPIRLVKPSFIDDLPERQTVGSVAQKVQGFPRQTGMLAAAALTVVVVLSFGVVTLKNNSTYVMRGLPVSRAFSASVNSAASTAGDMIENFVSPELIYIRSE